MKSRISSAPPSKHRRLENQALADLMRRFLEQPWVWALLGTLVLWILLSAGAGQVSVGSLSGILASAAVLCVVAIGQMLVVTTGNGAVDLSIPNVMTLSGFLATSFID